MLLKLTEHLYVNTESLADIEYTPRGIFSENAFLTARYHGSHLQPIDLKGQAAEEAFANWKAAHAQGNGK